MKDKNEVLATERLLDTIRGENRPEADRPVEPASEPGAATDAPLRDGVWMSRPLRSRSLLPGRVRVGLDIGGRNVKLARMERTGKGFRLLQLGVAEVGFDEETEGTRMDAKVTAARALLADAHLDKEALFTCMDDPGIIIRQMALPYMPARDLGRAIPFEARKHIPYEAAKVTLRYQVVSGGKKDSVYQILLVAGPNEALNRHLELVKRLGVKPQAVEVAPLVLVNTYLLASRNPKETIVLVDLGAGGTLIDIRRDDGMFFCRHLPISGDRFTTEIHRRMNVSLEAAERLKRGERLPGEPGLEDVQEALGPVLHSLVIEIRRSLAYYDNVTGRLGFSRLLMTGGGARLPGLKDLLEEALELPVQVMDPLEGITWDDAHFAQGWIQDTRPLWALAVGLAARP